MDGNGNTTSYSYLDSFFDDNGANPPNPRSGVPLTNAYLTNTINALSQHTSSAYYYGTGLLGSHTDVNNNVVYQHFTDQLDRPTATKLPDGGAVSTTYTGQNQADTYSLINGTTTRQDEVIFDDLGRKMRTNLVSDPDGSDRVDITYDALNRVASTSNPHRSAAASTDGTSTYSYDAIGRITTVTAQDGSKSHNYYGVDVSANGGLSSQLCAAATYGVGFPTLSADEANKKRETWIDGFGRLIEIDEPNAAGSLSIPTCYAYDLQNNLTSVLQNGSRQRTITYDSLSRMTKVVNPESGITSYGYDSNGNILQKTSPAPNQTAAATVTISYCYDALNRSTAKGYATSPNPPQTCSGNPPSLPSPAATFTFDSSAVDFYSGLANTVGRLVKSTTSGITPTARYLNYDPLGRVRNQYQCAVINCYGNTNAYVPWNVSYTYDLAGDVTSYADSGGNVFTQTFDAAGRPSKLTSSWVDANHPNVPLVSVNSTTGYYPVGTMRAATLGNGLTETSAYNNRLQPCRINVNSSSSAYSACTDGVPSGSLLDFTYGFNSGSADNGDVATWAATGNLTFNRTYTYDSLNRLSAMADSSSAQSCKGISETYDAWGNRLAETPTAGTGCPMFQATVSANNQLTAPYTYDAAGNMTYDVNHHYNYDAENRLTQVDNATTASYLYDATGKRVMKQAAGNTTFYIYDQGGNVLSERDSSNSWIQTYIRFAETLTAFYKGTGTIYFHLDHLGSVRLYTSVSGTAYGTALDYDPFGLQFAGSTTVDALQFTGKEPDSESGLDNFGARYNSSNMGRFMSPDPTMLSKQRLRDPQQWNMYAYVRNNPLAHIDPDGKACSALNNGSAYCQRADLYANFDSLVHDKTRFFAAASAASQALANVAVPGLGRVGTSSGTRAFLESTGEALQALNTQTVGKIVSGQITGSGAGLDAQIVHLEQTAVQGQLDSLKQSDPTGYSDAVKEINSLLNSNGGVGASILGEASQILFGTDKAYADVLADVRKSLGHDIDFANQQDREAIGNALTNHVRQTNGCDVAGDRANGCPR